ncbi:hypothetical protein B0H14DRAFT_3453376 [Mycena olivaceomarginata]|nr:hypothetical protein B0H14DRAFT_3453376 [Mycena olivaceomarginata]
MLHKRAIREQEHSKKGSDLALTCPGAGGNTLSLEPFPKDFARTINTVLFGSAVVVLASGSRFVVPFAVSFRMDALVSTIACGSLGYTMDMARRVLAVAPYLDMRPLVHSAVQSSLATVRAQHKKGASTTPSPPCLNLLPPPSPLRNKHTSHPKNQCTPPPPLCRLNNMAQALPKLSSFVRKILFHQYQYTHGEGRQQEHEILDSLPRTAACNGGGKGGR